MDSEEQAASNQPSTSNRTNVDEQGQPIGERQYNVQGDLVINQYQGPPPVDVSALVLKETKPTTESLVQPTTKTATKSLVPTTTKPTTESLVPTTTKPTTACSSKTIGPKGGTIEVGECALIVPAGALDEDVTIKLSLLHKQKQSFVTQSIQCEPLIEFQQPVTLKLKALKPDVTLLKDYKIQWSNDGEDWDILREPELHLIDQSFEFQLHRLYPFIAIKEQENKDTIEVQSVIYCHSARNADAVVWKLQYHDKRNKSKLDYDEISRKNLVIPIRNISLTIKDMGTEKVIVKPASVLIKQSQLNKKLNIDQTFWFLEENRDIYVKAVLAAGDDIHEEIFLLRKLKQQASDKPVTMIAHSTLNSAAVQSDHVTISK